MAPRSPTIGAIRRDGGPALGTPVIGRAAVGAPRLARLPAPDPAVQARRWVAAIDRWELVLTGTHHSGLSNAAVLAVRRREGRPFDADTPALRAFAAKRVYADPAQARRFSPWRAEAVWGDAAIEWIGKRIAEGGRDVALRPLTAAYARCKARAGKAGRPIGVWSGRWAAAVARGRVYVTTRET